MAEFCSRKDAVAAFASALQVVPAAHVGALRGLRFTGGVWAAPESRGDGRRVDRVLQRHEPIGQPAIC
jgi:hypothetical protein